MRDDLLSRPHGAVTRRDVAPPRARALLLACPTMTPRPRSAPRLAAFASLLLACTPLVGSSPPADATDGAATDGSTAADGATDRTPTADATDDAAGPSCPPPSSAPGELDATRSSETSELTLSALHAHGLVVDARGRTYVVGAAGGCGTPARTDSDGFVARFSSDGVLDATWGVGGLVCVGQRLGGEALDEDFSACAFDARGRLVAAGAQRRRGVLTAGLVARFTESGAPDTTFDDDGVAQVAAPARALPAMLFHDLVVDGPRIVVAASNADVWQVATFGGAVALREDGALDTSFHATGYWIDDQSAGYHAITKHRDGYALVGVRATGLVPRVARFDAAGALDARFGAGGYAELPAVENFADRAAASDAAGNLYVGGGQFVSGAGLHFGLVARFTLTGRLDTAWATGGVYRTGLYWEAAYQLARGLALDCTGRLLVVGTAADRVVRLQRLGLTGALDPSFGVEGAARVDPMTPVGIFRGAPQVVVGPRGATVLTGRNDSHTIGLWHFSL